MSNPFKKVFKSVTKVFKKVVKFAKKVVKKILPIVAVAAAVYFGGYYLAQGHLAGSGTHLSSMLTGGGMGQGGSLFVPGANSAASAKIADAGLKVGQGWLGGSGFPGMGTKESVTAINNTATLNAEVATNTAMTETVDAAGNFTDLGVTTPTAPAPTGVAPGASAGATPADYAANNRVTPMAQGNPPTTPVDTMGAGAPTNNGLLASDSYTANATGVPTSGGTYQTDLANQFGVSPNAITPASNVTTNATGSGLLQQQAMTPQAMTPTPIDRYYTALHENLVAETAAKAAAEKAAANAPWYSRAWNGLGEYGKSAAVMGGMQVGGQMLAGYAKGSAEEEAANREAEEEENARNRMNAQMYGRYTYVPGKGVVYTPWTPTTTYG